MSETPENLSSEKLIKIFNENGTSDAQRIEDEAISELLLCFTCDKKSPPKRPMTSKTMRTTQRQSGELSSETK